jgi:hypothetical protein
MRLRRNLGALLSLAFLGAATYGCESTERKYDAPSESGGAAGEASNPTGSGGTAGSGKGGSAGAEECSDGVAECVEETTARVCEEGTWKTTDCEGETPLCFEGRCVACEPGTEECRNDVAHRCDSDGGWESLNACQGEDIECADCTLGKPCAGAGGCGKGYCLDDECVECEPGTADCVGVTPRLCSDDGTWVNQAPCSGELPLCDEDTGACVCEEDAHSCIDDTTERRCVDGAWKVVECDRGCITGQGVDACLVDTLDMPGVVMCDPSTNMICDVSGGNVCCLAQEYIPEHTCTAPENCPQPQGGSIGRTTRHRCDSADDCPSGQGCCFVQYYYVETSCSKSPQNCHYTGGPQSRLVCDPDGDPCPEGRVCKPRRFEWAEQSVDVGLHTCEDP